MDCSKRSLKLRSIDSWQGEPISLELDHKNGNHNDNRLENLCILCPNCHSQTPTFRRRKSSLNKVIDVNDKRKFLKTRIVHNFCSDCGKSITNKSKRCKSCAAKLQKTKINWVSDEELVRMISETSRLQASKVLGVSETSVRKRLKSRNIII